MCILGGIGALSLIVTHTQPTKEEIAASKAAIVKQEARRKAAQEDSTRAAIKAQEENTVAAKTLLHDYKTDASRTDFRYKGRNLYVEGKIDNIDKRYGYSKFLSFTEEKFGPIILCRLKDKQEASHLNEGDYVAVSGVYSSTKNIVYIEDAHIVPTVADWKTTVSSK
jgi:hypothetical protein